MPPDATSIKEVFLRPGEHHFGKAETRIRTILGSCVSLVFWHPQKQVGGMCHYLLPSRGENRTPALNGLYGDEAIELMFHEIRRLKTHPTEFKVRIFGGGDMFPHLHKMGVQDLVGQQNVRLANRLIEEHSLNCVTSHVEGIGHRHLVFDVWSGLVTMKFSALSSPAGKELK